MNGTNAALYGFDLSSNDLRFAIVSGVPPEWLATMGDYTSDLGELFAAVGDVSTRPIEQFHVVRQDVPDDVWHANRYVREWWKPQGICDLLQATLARSDQRFAAFSIGRHVSVGVISPREVEIMSLLAPHLRRAVAIADLIDMKTVEANLFTEAWNKKFGSTRNSGPRDSFNPWNKKFGRRNSGPRDSFNPCRAVPVRNSGPRDSFNPCQPVPGCRHGKASTRDRPGRAAPRHPAWQPAPAGVLR
jgi:hypothetical protein